MVGEAQSNTVLEDGRRSLKCQISNASFTKELQVSVPDVSLTVSVYRVRRSCRCLCSRRVSICVCLQGKKELQVSVPDVSLTVSVYRVRRSCRCLCSRRWCY